jgi:hypothetical protein
MCQENYMYVYFNHYVFKFDASSFMGVKKSKKSTGQDVYYSWEDENRIQAIY